MIEIKFNANDTVMVRLKDIGRAEAKRQWEEVAALSKRALPAHVPRAEDEEGWSKWQLWDLMNTFGHMMSLGREMPFWSDIKIVTES